MKKKILIIGNSASGYALAKYLSDKHEIYITPATDTLKEFAECVDIREDNVAELLEFVMENGIDLTIPISNKAINTDIATIFANHKQVVFAPSAGAFEIVSNKVFAKKVLYKLRIPTPKFGIFEKQNLAFDYIKNQSYPYVIKTNDSNSAVIITSSNVAKTILESSFIDKNNRVIIEDYISGIPFSFYTLTDGYKSLPIGSSIVYRHSLDGNGGQLTSGMGSCVPNYKLSEEDEYSIMDNIIYPTLDYLEVSGKPYIGILGINGILTDDHEIIVLGWNSFMNDCDTAAILANINDDIYSLFESCVIGSFSDEVDNINFNNTSSVTLVLRSNNRLLSENVISGFDSISDDTLLTFYPNVTKNKYLEYEASCGEVLALTADASTFSRAAKKVYLDADDIQFLGKVYRKDICIVNA